MKEPASFLKKPLSLLITDVLCSEGGNLWDFMHSQFRWSSSPLSLSVALKWQHHYCLFEHSGDMASFPLAWWNRSYKKGAAAAAVIARLGLGTVTSDGFPLCAHVLWSDKAPPRRNSVDRKSNKNILRCCVWLTRDERDEWKMTDHEMWGSKHK